ncbi:MAG TPA: hypothetical protein VFP72_23665 [Kineosporiaceae bacterium]|nr:hypothetical protein [Kineosporiaceae bacterium]
MNRFARAAVATALAGAAVLLPAASAPATTTTNHSVLGLPDCKNPPTPEVPSAGLTSVLDSGPQNPRNGDPWGNPPTSTVYEEYHWAGAQWRNYDLGCGPDAARDMGDSAWGVMADGSLQTLTAVSSLTVGVTRYGFEPQRITGVLDPVGKVMRSAFGGYLYPSLIGYSIIATGLLILWRVRRDTTRQAAEHAGWAFMITVAATGALAWAFSLGPLVDQGLTQVLNVASQATAQIAPGSAGAESAGDNLGASVQHAIVYETWLAGQFGRTDSPAAKKYGPELWRASAFTRAEVDAIIADPSKAAPLVEQKQNAYKAAAAAVQSEDPAAYEYLAGHRNFNRWAYTLLGWLGLAAIAPFVIVASLLLIWGVTVFRLALWILPLIAVLAVIPRFRSVFTRAVDIAVGGILNAATFGAVTLVWITAVGAIIGPETGANPVAVFLVLAVAETFMIKFLRPWQRIKRSVDLARRGGKLTAKSFKEGWDEAGRGRNGATGSQSPKKPAFKFPDPGEPGPIRGIARAAIQGGVAGYVASAASGGTAAAAAAAARAATAHTTANTSTTAKPAPEASVPTHTTPAPAPATIHPPAPASPINSPAGSVTVTATVVDSDISGPQPVPGRRHATPVAQSPTARAIGSGPGVETDDVELPSVYRPNQAPSTDVAPTTGDGAWVVYRPGQDGGKR